jgi:hypothetical protein
MEIKELKILLKLLTKKDYRGKISEVKPNDQTKVNVTRNLCEQLFNRQYIDVEKQILKLEITNNGGKTLKNKKLTEGLSNLEIKILKTCSTSTIQPSQIKIKPASKRNELILNLLEQELISIAEQQITQIWLTSEGEEFLAQEFLLEGIGNINLPKQLLNNYLIFIRKYFQQKIVNPQPKPNDEEVLQTIIQLDQELNTDNYLPIFHLRNKYQSLLNRQELDNILYSLQRQNKLSMSRLVDGSRYSPEEYDAGIPQNVGGPIFYLIVKMIN